MRTDDAQERRPVTTRGALKSLRPTDSVTPPRHRRKRPVRLDDWRGMLLTTSFVDELERGGWR